jgi:outer membrane immunogenic protein
VSSFVGGGQLGFNWQAPGSNWVLGVEGQASWAADLKGEHIAGGDEVLQTKVKWLATVAPRLGYAWDRALLYAKGGVAFAGDKHTHFDTDAPTVVFVGDKIRTGWMVGGGVEVALSGNWTAKGEYNFMDFGKKDITFSAPSDSFPIGVEQKIHLVKFGINYRFGSSAPVAARY